MDELIRGLRERLADVNAAIVSYTDERDRITAALAALTAEKPQAQPKRKRGRPGVNPEHIVSYLANGPRRLKDIARDCYPNKRWGASCATEMLSTLVARGMVVRPSRGVYALPKAA